MNLRAFADTYRWLRGLVRPVWTGNYTRFEDVPVSGPGFDGETWTVITREHTRRALAALRGGSLRPTGDRALLPEIAVRVLAERGVARIIDFGGGMGISYIDVRSVVGRARIEYVVVDTDAVCAAGRSLFADDPAIRFATSLAEAGADADIVYVSSALQYVPDPLAALRELAGLGARHLLLVNASAGDIPTYATAQHNVHGSVIAYWFLAESSVVDGLGSLGYVQRRASASERRLTGFAVPRRYRIARGRNLLFERAASRE